LASFVCWTENSTIFFEFKRHIAINHMPSNLGSKNLSNNTSRMNNVRGQRAR
jgi:hypothetical protein